MTDRARFAVWHKWDRNFFAGFVVVGWFLVVMGFYGSVRERIAGHADFPAPPILLLHIVVFTGWMLLLTAQVLLIRADRRDIHRRLGMIGVALVPLMVVTGIGAEVVSQRFYAVKYPDNLNFFIMPLIEMLVFTLCAVAALMWRKDAAAHKRLIFLATSMALVAATNRWWGEGLYELYGDGFWGMITHNFAGPNVLMAVAVGYDWLTRGRVHRVYWVAVPLILGGEVVASVIYHDPAWAGVVKWMIGI